MKGIKSNHQLSRIERCSHERMNVLYNLLYAESKLRQFKQRAEYIYKTYDSTICRIHSECDGKLAAFRWCWMCEIN